MYLALGVALFVEERIPGCHRRSFAHRDADFAQDGCIETLLLHIYRYLVDAGHILALHHTLQINVTEGCHLHAQRVVKVALCA